MSKTSKVIAISEHTNKDVVRVKIGGTVFELGFHFKDGGKGGVEDKLLSIALREETNAKNV